MRCVVEVGERPIAGAAAPIAWEAVRDAVRAEPAQDDLLPARMTEPTRLVPSFDAAGLYAAASFARGRDWLEATLRPDAPDPCRLRVRARLDDRQHLDRRGAVPAQRRLPGLRAPDARLPARPRPAGALHVGLPADRSAARDGRACSAPMRRTPGSRPMRRATAGSSSTRPTTAFPTSATSRWPGAPTSPMRCRCAACCSAVAASA